MPSLIVSLPLMCTRTPATISMVHAHSFEILNARFPVTEKIAATVMGIKSTTLINDAQKKSQMNLKRLIIDFINKYQKTKFHLLYYYTIYIFIVNSKGYHRLSINVLVNSHNIMLTESKKIMGYLYCSFFCVDNNCNGVLIYIYKHPE